MMKYLGKIPLFIVTVLAWIVIISSCANQGMPTGGPRDTIPPILISTQPDYRALNYNNNEVRFTFNEYVVTDQIADILVVSPPLEKRPTVRTRSKTLIVQFNEELKDSTTYSLDFKNSIEDNNEGNPLENMRFSFSTGNTFDSLRVAGKVVNSFTMEPVPGSLVVLHDNFHDSTIFTERPDFIAKTDELGIFMIDNIPSGKYHLFAINDANSDLKYNEGAEEIAFYDSIVVPSAEFVEELDTLVNGVDSLLITGHVHFSPDPIYLKQFTEDLFEQYLDSYKRETRYKSTFVFGESVSDTFNIELLNVDAQDWYLLEPDANMDSITMWITDTLVANRDTLLFDVSYFQLDSVEQLYLHHDTIQMNFSEPEEVETTRTRRRNRADEEEQENVPPPIEQFRWITSFSSTVELNEQLKLSSPQPLNMFDKNSIHLFLSDDTLKTPLEFQFGKDSVQWRTYNISYDWEPETDYTLEIDSAGAENIYGITSRKLSSEFETREEDYYGRILVACSNVSGPTIVQLMDSNEKLLSEKKIYSDQTVIFDYLEPTKYILKVIFDTNNNGEWDTGSYQDKFQPEQVYYWNKVIKVRSNWDSSVPWDLKPDPTYVKIVVDEELEEQRRKEAEEDARREEENQMQQQQINPLQIPGGGGIQQQRR